MKKLTLIAVSIVLAAATSACDLNPGPVASAPAGGIIKVFREVDFDVRTVDDLDNDLRGESVDVTVNAYDIKGRQALYKDKDANEFIPGPQVLPFRFTPWEYTATIGSESLTKVTIVVTWLHAEVGQGVLCEVSVTGQPLPIPAQSLAFASYTGEPLHITCTYEYIA